MCVPDQNKNASRKHSGWKILIQHGPFEKTFHSKREGWFTLYLIPNLFMSPRLGKNDPFCPCLPDANTFLHLRQSVAFRRAANMPGAEPLYINTYTDTQVAHTKEEENEVSGVQQSGELRRDIWRRAAIMAFAYNTGRSTLSSSSSVISGKLAVCKPDDLFWFKAWCITLFSIHVCSEVPMSDHIDFNLMKVILHTCA